MNESMPEHPNRTPDPIREWRVRNPKSERALVLLEADWPPSRAIVLRFIADVSAAILEPAQAQAVIDRGLAEALRAYRDYLDPGTVPDRDRLMGLLRGLATAVRDDLPGAPAVEDLMARWLPENLAAFFARANAR
jgi:hypothetical protein